MWVCRTSTDKYKVSWPFLSFAVIHPGMLSKFTSIDFIRPIHNANVAWRSLLEEEEEGLFIRLSL